MSATLDTSKVIFIGGAPRSGTTLVQRIIGSHSLVYGGPEFDLVPEIIELRNRFHASVESGRISKYLTSQEVDDLFGKFISLTFSYKLKKLEGKIYLSEKTPSNVMVFPELAQIFPESHLIFVIRDPRAVVASMIQVGKRYHKEGKSGPLFTKNIRCAIEYINACWSVGSKAVEKYPNVHVVYYEDIISDTQLTIERIAKQLEIPFESEMLQMKEYDISEFKVGEQYWYTKEQLRAPIMQDPSDAWREQLTKYQQYIICKRIQRIPGIERYDLKSEDRLPYKLADLSVSLGMRVHRSIIKIIAKLGRLLFHGLS